MRGAVRRASSLQGSHLRTWRGWTREGARSNKGMKLTSLVAAPVWQAEVPPRAPHSKVEGRTGSQLIPGVRRTHEAERW